MTGTAYRCAFCGHLFRTADDIPRDARTVMCPACGSIDVNIVTVRGTPTVRRAATPARCGRDEGVTGSG